MPLVHAAKGAALSMPLTPKPEQSKRPDCYTTVHVLLLFLFIFCLFSFPFLQDNFGKDVSKQALLTRLPVSWSSGIASFKCMPVCAFLCGSFELAKFHCSFFYPWSTTLHTKCFVCNGYEFKVPIMQAFYNVHLISLCLITPYIMYVNMYSFSFLL